VLILRKNSPTAVEADSLGPVEKRSRMEAGEVDYGVR